MRFFGRLLRGVAMAAVLYAMLAPELARYEAERMLRGATEAFRYIESGRGEVTDREGALGRIGQIADAAAEKMVGDPRPRVMAGLARLRAGQAERARELFARALSLGERAEVDLHLANAYGALGDSEKAMATIRRAVWVSPALIPMLPFSSQEKHAIGHWVLRLEAELKAGNLKQPPPLP